ncbi:hypothetical protein LSAT2_024378 [Lamellibrachia satsuma]|nr:hypothetical protein LSAT2_024378 [Lamellibrachia satsuma]
MGLWRHTPTGLQRNKRRVRRCTKQLWVEQTSRHFVRDIGVTVRTLDFIYIWTGSGCVKVFETSSISINRFAGSA